MPSAEIRRNVVDLAWSLWVGLGVSGWSGRHRDHAVDPEALIILTAWLADSDPRLRDESLDWCVRYGRFVSGTRLKNLLSVEPPARRDACARYAAIVAEHAPWRWLAVDADAQGTGPAQPVRFEPSGKSSLDLAVPSSLALRLRAIFGVTARAEIMRCLIAQPHLPVSASDLVPDVGSTKRNVADALDALHMAGVIEVIPWRNQLRYRLTDPRATTRFIGEIPTHIPRWVPILRIVSRALEVTETNEGRSASVARVETDAAVAGMQPDLFAADIPGPGRADDEGSVETFDVWAARLTLALASGEPVSRSERQPATR